MRFNAKFTAVATASVFGASVLFGHSAYAETPQQARPESKTATADAKKDQAKPQPVTVTVQAGDSLSLIADAHQTTWVRIFDANASIADPNIINPDETVTIPTEDQQLPDRYGEFVAAHPAATTPPVASPASASSSARGTYATSSAGASAHASAVSSGNHYQWGTCTWYVYNRRPNIGSFWGNAGYNWLSEARAAGFATGSSPAPGAIAVTGGHVAIVESVSGGMVNISEMNYAGGVGVVHYRTVSAGSFQYIY